MRGLHLQVWLGVADLPNAMPFAILYGLQGVARALPLTILPLTALEIMGSAQQVSLLYFGASFVGLAGSLSMPLLVHMIRRRRVVALGTVLICLAALLLSLGSGIVFAAGLACFLVGFIAIDISFNLYLMDHIPRQEFGRFEPVRVLFMGSGFIIGPMAGIWLSQAFGRPAPFIAMAVVTVLVYLVFFYLRFSDNKAIQAAKSSPPNPFKFFPHFFKQNRLRLAWLLAVGRSSWWAMFFVYGPIYCVEAGLGETVAGMLVSAGSGAVLLCPLWAWLGHKWGIRRLLMVGYAASAVASLAVALVAGTPWLGVVFFLIAAFFTSIIDGAGNMLFLRAVHAHERAEMTSVFATFRDTSQIGPPGVFSLLLSVFALPAVFVAAGAGMMIMAWYSRYIPKQY
ncbi:MAG: MFS transporter [Alphaproteobacteria bacterium]|nr:MFS transporter [Rhodospirillaceae bacterium]MBT6205635.1 MFS transporter [Rhodospirillaceae bacterium]MBT6510085.1 MFS transporter [Rhodospirillaceae bacterium]MDG2482583.1 MFS transporter [Alphaproteobacteria bacterium]